MLITHFNRYFEKHGRKTYIALGVIISLMFVVFVTPGDVFGRSQGISDFGRMYGKKLKRDEMMKRMNEAYVGICLKYPQAFGQDLGNEILFHEALNRMRLLREAKAQKVAPASDREIAETVRKSPLFNGPDGAFSAEALNRFLQFRGLDGGAFDRIVADNIRIERLENSVTAAAAADPAEAQTYIEKYTASMAEIPLDMTLAYKPEQAEIESYFATRRNELRLPDSKTCVVAQFTSEALLARSASDAALKARLEPTAEAVQQQYETFKESSYKGKSLDEVKVLIASTLRNRTARRIQEEAARALTAAFATEVKDESTAERLVRFREVAASQGGQVVDSGFFSLGDMVPGLEGNRKNLADAIRAMDKIGAVTEPLFDWAGFSVACLKEQKPTPLPETLNEELQKLIADRLVGERAMLQYAARVAPHAEAAVAVKEPFELGRERMQAIQQDAELSDDEKQAQMGALQEELREWVMPFFRPARRSFALATFKPEGYLAGIQDADLDLQAGYDQRAAEYQKKEVRLSRISQSLEGQDEAGKASRRTRLAEARTRLLAGAAFADLRQEFSDQVDNEEPALVDVNSLDPAVRAAVAELEAGQVSDIIETADALLLVNVLEKRNGRTLAEVKDELTALLKQEKAEQLAFDDALSFAQKATDLWDKAIAAKKPFDSAASFAELSREAYPLADISSADKLTRNDLIPSVNAREQALAEAIFNASEKTPLTSAVKGTKASYVACLLTATPSFLADPAKDAPAMDTLKRIFARHSAMEATLAKAQAEAARISTALQAGSELAKAAAPLAFNELPVFGMDVSSISQKAMLSDLNGFVSQLGKATAGSLLAPQKTYGGYALVYLASRSVPDDEESKTMLENVKSYLLRREQQRLLGAFYQRLEKESNTQLREELRLNQRR